MLNHSAFLWIMRWQFAQTSARSVKRVRVPGLNSASGTV
jgi:hypothetical protein